ncbi:hypothetical protein Q8W71_28900, partial [Methylobacterium sp. NEAU 140]|uniref:hypothetical protein n=1 Tax=Methylobacterium sp. NEAU 140 TaxID=3064945 RepID=UPI0027361E3C
GRMSFWFCNPCQPACHIDRLHAVNPTRGYDGGGRCGRQAASGQGTSIPARPSGAVRSRLPAASNKGQGKEPKPEKRIDFLLGEELSVMCCFTANTNIAKLYFVYIIQKIRFYGR